MVLRTEKVTATEVGVEHVVVVTIDEVEVVVVGLEPSNQEER